MVSEFTIFDVAPEKEVARGQVCKAWWPCERTASANPVASEIFVSMLAARKSKVRWNAILLINHLCMVVPKLEKEKVAKHSFAALTCDALVF